VGMQGMHGDTIGGVFATWKRENE